MNSSVKKITRRYTGRRRLSYGLLIRIRHTLPVHGEGPLSVNCRSLPVVSSNTRIAGLSATTSSPNLSRGWGWNHTSALSGPSVYSVTMVTNSELGVALAGGGG